MFEREKTEERRKERYKSRKREREREGGGGGRGRTRQTCRTNIVRQADTQTNRQTGGYKIREPVRDFFQWILIFISNLPSFRTKDAFHRSEDFKVELKNYSL